MTDNTQPQIVDQTQGMPLQPGYFPQAVDPQVVDQSRMYMGGMVPPVDISAMQHNMPLNLENSSQNVNNYIPPQVQTLQPGEMVQQMVGVMPAPLIPQPDIAKIAVQAKTAAEVMKVVHSQEPVQEKKEEKIPTNNILVRRKILGEFIHVISHTGGDFYSMNKKMDDCREAYKNAA